MPSINYDTETMLYRATVSCSRAGCATQVQSAPMEYPEARAALQNADLAGVEFGFSNTRHEYRSRCRACDSLASAESRRRRAMRVANGEVLAGRRGAEHRVYVEPGQRRFGVEMELAFPTGTPASTLERALASAGLVGWRVKGDASLYGMNGKVGWEITSPILSGADGEEQVRKACAAMDAKGATVNRKTGLHVHHEVRDLGIDGMRRLVRSWYNNQRVIDQIVAPSRRDGMNHFAQNWHSHELSRLDAIELSRVHRVSGTRYKTLNVNSYPRYGTVEVRQHQGSCSAAKIIAWIRFVQRIIEASRVDVLVRQDDIGNLVSAICMDDDDQAYLIGRAQMLTNGRAAA